MNLGVSSVGASSRFPLEANFPGLPTPTMPKNEDWKEFRRKHPFGSMKDFWEWFRNRKKQPPSVIA